MNRTEHVLANQFGGHGLIFFFCRSTWKNDVLVTRILCFSDIGDQEGVIYYGLLMESLSCLELSNFEESRIRDHSTWTVVQNFPTSLIFLCNDIPKVHLSVVLKSGRLEISKRSKSSPIWNFKPWKNYHFTRGWSYFSKFSPSWRRSRVRSQIDLILNSVHKANDKKQNLKPITG